MNATTTNDAIELRRCIYSLMGQLSALCDELPDSSESRVLRAIVEGGMPELLPFAHALVGDQEHQDKSFSRGYQVAILSIREESGERDAAAWRQDPDEFMRAIGRQYLAGEQR